ncbi:hypothetical protein JJB09_12680 [Rhizobium sp. KVB221]|uniref:Uncharacterized protein n=1 Tax=Rhizobium setariae TaxID=2801340 RepID=A0A936YU29_9HYPH|nr:hypothetical protein [Rhizobium setariae]MBL0372882.1 hypothetical protein [Rhizobium setariae]
MLYLTFTLMAGVISFMFIATAVSSIINLVREGEATKEARARTVVYQ